MYDSSIPLHLPESSHEGKQNSRMDVDSLLQKPKSNGKTTTTTATRGSDGESNTSHSGGGGGGGMLPRPVRHSVRSVVGADLQRQLLLQLSDGVSDNSDVQNAIAVVTQVELKYPHQVCPVVCTVLSEQRVDLVFRLAEEIRVLQLCTAIHNKLPLHLKDIEVMRQKANSDPFIYLMRSPLPSPNNNNHNVSSGGRAAVTNVQNELTVLRVELWRDAVTQTSEAGISFRYIVDHGRHTDNLKLDDVQPLTDRDRQTVHAISRCIFNMEAIMPAVRLEVESPAAEVCRDRYCLVFQDVESLRYSFLLQLLDNFQDLLLDVRVPLGRPRACIWMRHHGASLSAVPFVLQSNHNSVSSLPVSLMSLPQQALTRLRKRKRAFEDVVPRNLPAASQSPAPTFLARLFGRGGSDDSSTKKLKTM
jgi:hypothetical protein